jgi:hypothetical protein
MVKGEKGQKGKREKGENRETETKGGKKADSAG